MNQRMFRVLTGGKLKKQVFETKNIFDGPRILYRCIEKVIFEDGIDRIEAENILHENYYVGMNAYNYIVRHYSNQNKVLIYYRRNPRLKLEAFVSKGKIIFYIPDLKNKDF